MTKKFCLFVVKQLLRYFYIMREAQLRRTNKGGGGLRGGKSCYTYIQETVKELLDYKSRFFNSVCAGGSSCNEERIDGKLISAYNTKSHVVYSLPRKIPYTCGAMSVKMRSMLLLLCAGSHGVLNTLTPIFKVKPIFVIYYTFFSYNSLCAIA